jgi:hypothetical protein
MGQGRILMVPVPINYTLNPDDTTKLPVNNVYAGTVTPIK